MKAFAVFVLVFASLVPTYADTTQTQTWNVTAVCQEGIPSFPCFAQSLTAVFTTQLETGTFVSTDNLGVFTGTEPVVIGMTGTLDGVPLTFVPQGPPFGPFGWLDNGAPEGIGFMAGGVGYGAVSDIDTVIFSSSANPPGVYEFMNWSAVEVVPEPSALLLLTALLLLALMRWAQLSLRKLSGR